MKKLIIKLLKMLGYKPEVEPPKIEIKHVPLKCHKLARQVARDDLLLEMPEFAQKEHLAKEFSKSIQKDIIDNMIIEKDPYRMCFVVTFEYWLKDHEADK